MPNKSLARGLGIAQQQMVEVAKALSLDAKILIMDEPLPHCLNMKSKSFLPQFENLSRKVFPLFIFHIG